MAYGLRYTFSFQDQIYEAPATFRIEIEQKDYVGATATLPYMANAPVIMERTADDESKLTTIIGTKLTLSFAYDGSTNVPHPTLFKNMPEDGFRVSVFKNNILNFRGFVKPDAATYPFAGAPFTYSITATDYFNGMKAKVIDLNVSGQFFYDYISYADMLRRTLFNVIDYTGAAVKVLFRLRPDNMPGPPAVYNILTAVYFHTDAFYDVDDGPLSIYDALKSVLQSMGCRMFFSNGFYWIQRISDVTTSYINVWQFTPPSSVTQVDEFFHEKTNGTDFKVLASTGEIGTLPGVYNQKTTYKLKGINILQNFTWSNYTAPSTLPSWSVPGRYNITRVATGTATDPYRLRIFEPGAGSGFMLQDTTYEAGQRVQLQVRLQGNYAKDIGFGVLVGNNTADGHKVMDSAGNWIDRLSPGTDNSFFPASIPNSGQTTLNITSQPIPAGLNSNLLRFYITFPRPADTVPVGQTVYVDVYPVFLRVFTSNITARESNTYNANTYSQIPEGKNYFFVDTADDTVSNTIFYGNDLAQISPVEMDNWHDTDLNSNGTIDYWVGRTILDNFAVASNTFEADIRSNTLEFYQTVYIPQIESGVRLLQIRDTYNLRTGVHSILGHQVYTKGSGAGDYRVRNIIDDL